MNDPGALNVELSIGSAPNGAPQPGASFRVWGVGLPTLSQATNLYGKPVSVTAGMSAGLPLANPAQAGLLASGMVARAWGNFVGTDQTLDIVMSASATLPVKGGPDPAPVPRNIVLNWKKGQDLTQPLQQALQQAFPGFAVNMNIASSFKPPSDQVHFNGAIEQFGHYIRRYTQMLAGPGSEGVGIIFRGNNIDVVDGSQPLSGGTINYQDLVGQPTWIDYNKISIKLVMRGDLKINQVVTLPQTQVINSFSGGYGGSGAATPQNSLTFQGSFQITSIQHLGNFRQADSASWVTVVEATLQ